jgi:thioredoxin-related protein
MDNDKALFIEENVAQKFAVLGQPTLLLFVHCALLLFPWI